MHKSFLAKTTQDFPLCKLSAALAPVVMFAELQF